MALYITSLNSGSNGNCYYVGNDRDAVLVDVGLSCRETEKRMHKLGLQMDRVKAIFISHEHGDHIKGLTTLANKYQLPVYITPKTARNGPRLIGHLTQNFFAGQPVNIGSLEVTPFLKCHDAIDPHSFIISYQGTTVGVLTDIGQVCKEVIRYFKLCHAVFLEANYDEMMLENGRYPIYLKNRIRGGHGHLSNRQALELFAQHRSPNLSHVLLAHLSKENNCPELAEALFSAAANGVQVSVASRYHSTAVFTVCHSQSAPAFSQTNISRPMQLALFS